MARAITMRTEVNDRNNALEEAENRDRYSEFGDPERIPELFDDCGKLADFLIDRFTGTPREKALLANHLERLHTELSWEGGLYRPQGHDDENVLLPSNQSRDGGDALSESWSFAEAASRMRAQYATEIAYARYLHCCCEEEWERTWKHEQIFELTRQVREFVGPAQEPTTYSRTDLEIRISWDVVSYIDVELKVETAQALALHRRTSNQAQEARDVANELLVYIEALDSTSLLREFYRDMMLNQSQYYGAVAIAADAVQRFLYEPERDVALLDRASLCLREAEAEMSQAEDASELRAHRSSIDNLKPHAVSEWLELNEGQIVGVYPFGLTGTGVNLEEDVVSIVRKNTEWNFGPTTNINRPSYSLGADDIWNPSLEIPWFKDQYEGTRVTLQPILVVLPEDDADMTVRRDSVTTRDVLVDTHPEVSPRRIEFEVELIITNLGNHHLRFSTEIEDYSADVLASVTWLFAPECGDLLEYSELSAGIFLNAHPQTPGQDEAPIPTGLSTISEYAMAVISGVGKSLATALPDHDIETVAREGMYHLVVDVSAASAVGPNGSTMLTHPIQMLDCLGGRILNHPVPAGMHAIAQWVSYDERPVESVDGPSLNKDIILMQENLSVLASFASPRYAMNGPREAIEFAVSLEGMLQAWVNRLQKYYYDKVVGRLDTILSDSSKENPLAELDLDTIALLEKEQLKLRQFRTKSAITMLHVNSPAFVTSMATRRMLDEFIQRVGIPRMYDSYLEFSQDILESRLEELIISQVRASNEKRHERTRVIVDMAVIFAAMIGVSGVFALAQSGFGIHHPAWVTLMLIATIAIGVGASLLQGSLGRLWGRYTGLSRRHDQPEADSAEQATTSDDLMQT